MKPENSPNDEPDSDDLPPLTVWQVITSVLAAAFGVQRRTALERDFSRAKPGTYIIAGLIFTLVFILILVGVVKLVLSQVA